MHRLQHVPPRTAGDVENVDGTTGSVHTPDRRFQKPLQILPADANSFPADCVEVEVVDQLSQRTESARFVFVDIVERSAGIKTRLPTKTDAGRKVSIEV